MMTVRQRRWVAGSLATGLVLTLVFIASFDLSGNTKTPERFVLTEVSTFEAPPPPPPPPARPTSRPAGGSTGAQLTLRSSRAPTSLDKMNLDVQFAAAEVGNLNIAGLGLGIGLGVGDGIGNGSGSGYGLAGVSELDQTPIVVSAPSFPYPAKEAAERGIAAFDLEFDIVIDEEGRTYPIAIVSNPFPMFNSEFLEWASRVRFSPPTRLGIPVKTQYRWPVGIKP
jgi:hypothetical protein